MSGPPADLIVATMATPPERVAAALLAVAGTPAFLVAGARPIAVGWATVELDRAAAELAASFGFGAGQFQGATRSMLLGCASRVGPGVLPECGSLALVEPDTEGRLAASLARLGEGPSVIWLRADDPTTAIEALRAGGVVVSAERDGPFGPERLVVDGPVHGPHRLLVSASAGTIAP